MEVITKDQFANSTLWKFIDVVTRKAIAMVISILLARLIVPEAYGVVALTTVFITFTDIFILNGFNVALIRKEETSPIDYSTVTAMSLMVTLVLYSLFFVAAPHLASFYKSPELCPVLRVITLLLFFQSVATVIRAHATRKMAFKKMAISSFSSSVIAGVIAVVLAYMGWNVWALVAQQLLANMLDMLFMLFLFKWKISLRFSLERAKEMFRFTMGVLGASFLDFLGNNVCSLVIGRSYSTRDLGYYNRANMLPETISLNTYNSITSVLLPALASRQNDTESMKRVVRKVLSLTMFVIVPMMFGLIGTKDILIPVLLTEKWLPAASLIAYCSLYYAINPVRAIGYSVFYAKGKSSLAMNVEVVRSTLMILGIVLVVFVFKASLQMVLIVNTIISLVVAILTQYQVRRMLDYRASEFLADVGPTVVLSTIMMIIVWLLGKIGMNHVLLLIIQVLAGGLVYYLLSRLTKNKNLVVLMDYVKGRISREKK